MLQVIMKHECVVAIATQGGGIYETLEVSNFCAEHGIVSDVEVIPIQRINEAYEHVLNSACVTTSPSISLAWTNP